MARTVYDSDLSSRTSRMRLSPARKPKWRLLERGLHLGYRRGPRGGVWFVRRFSAGSYFEKSIGTADDATDADGQSVFTFSQAQNIARAWWQAETRRERSGTESNSPITVDGALKTYFATRAAKGSKGWSKDASVAQRRITPVLGNIQVERLTRKQLSEWHMALATSAKLVRTSKKAAKPSMKVIDQSDPNATRSRRATANRILTILKSALNQAFHDGGVTSDDAWRRVKPFRNVDVAVVRYASEDECRRLVNACQSDMRQLVTAALLTGCRYGELVSAKVGELDFDARTLAIKQSKSGKSRHVVLTSEATDFFGKLTVDKAKSELIFRRLDGGAWGSSHQQRPLIEACEKARISPALTFHVLRHTHASLLAMKGAPMGVIAAQLGHADTRMTEKHYAHLAPSYVADTIRASFPDLMLTRPNNIQLMAKKSKQPT